MTAAQDSPDAWGVTELAIGHFQSDTPIQVGVQEVIVHWWTTLRGDCDQPRWEYLFDEGQIDASSAHAWADAVWGTDDAEGAKNEQ